MYLWSPLLPGAAQLQAGGGAGNTIAVPAGALTLTGYAPTVSVTNHQRVSVPAGALTLTGYAPSVAVSDNQRVSVPAGSLTLTGYAPAVTQVIRIAVPGGTITLTGYAPEVISTRLVGDYYGSSPRRRWIEVEQPEDRPEPVVVRVPAGRMRLKGLAPSVLITRSPEGQERDLMELMMLLEDA